MPVQGEGCAIFSIRHVLDHLHKNLGKIHAILEEYDRQKFAETIFLQTRNAELKEYIVKLLIAVLRLAELRGYSSQEILEEYERQRSK